MEADIGCLHPDDCFCGQLSPRQTRIPKESESVLTRAVL